MKTKTLLSSKIAPAIDGKTGHSTGCPRLEKRCYSIKNGFLIEIDQKAVLLIILPGKNQDKAQEFQ